LIVQAQAAPCFSVIISQNCFHPGVSQESPQNTQASLQTKEKFILAMDVTSLSDTF